RPPYPCYTAHAHTVPVPRLHPYTVDDDGSHATHTHHLRSSPGEKDAHGLGRRGRGQPEVLHVVERALDVHAFTRGDQTDDADRLADLLERRRERQAVPVGDDGFAGEPEAEPHAARGEVVEARGAP